MKSVNKATVSQLGLLLVAVIWGTSFVIVKNATDSITPSYMIFTRFFLAAAVTGIVFHKRLRQLNRKSLLSGAVLGTLLFLAYYVQTVGIQYTTAGNNAFLTAIYVILVPFLYWIVKKVRPGIYNVAAAVLCITGIGLISLQSGLSVNPGDVLSMTSGFCFAAQIVFTTIYTRKHDPLLLSVLQFGFCSLWGLAVGVVFEPFPSGLNQGAVFSLFYLGVVSTAVALVLQTVCQKFLPAAKASLLMSLESVFGCLSGVIFLGEIITPSILAGFVLIFAAIIISETKLSFFTGKFKRAAVEDE